MKIRKISRHRSRSPKYSELRPRPHVFGYFWIRNFFFPDSKIFPSTRSVFKTNSLVHTHPMVSGYTLEKLGLQVVPPYWFIVRYETGHDFATPLDSKISGFTVHTLSDSFGFIFFHPGERIKNIRIRFRIRRMRVDGSRIWKEKVADSKISEYVWERQRHGQSLITHVRSH